ncbi:hypothetical protein ACU4GR_26615 [Methylobacterium oryzae CBMB20]
MNAVDAARGDAREDAVAFGQRVLGPILTEFCLRLWLVERFLAPDKTVLLFCARGGLRLQLAYERFLERAGLPPNLPHAALMVSRLVAARTAFDPPSPGVLSELGREFSGRAMSEVAAALAQRDDLALPAAWDAPFQDSTFAALLAGNEPGVARLHAAVAQQDARFRAHLGCLRGHGAPLRAGRYGALRQYGPHAPGGPAGADLVRTPVRPLQLQAPRHTAFPPHARPERRERLVQALGRAEHRCCASGT